MKLTLPSTSRLRRRTATSKRRTRLAFFTLFSKEERKVRGTSQFLVVTEVIDAVMVFLHTGQCDPGLVRACLLVRPHKKAHRLQAQEPLSPPLRWVSMYVSMYLCVVALGRHNRLCVSSCCVITTAQRGPAEGHAACASREVGGGPSPGACPRGALRRSR